MVGHSAGAPARPPRCPRWPVLALAARRRNVRTDQKQSVIPHVYMFADVVSVHLIMLPRAMSACISASRGIIQVRRVFPRHAPRVSFLLCFYSYLDADPAPLGRTPLVSIHIAGKPNLVSKAPVHVIAQQACHIPAPVNPGVPCWGMSIPIPRNTALACAGAVKPRV